MGHVQADEEETIRIIVHQMDRLEQLRRQGLKGRLRKGVAYVGTVWRAGHRCKDGWKGMCNCGTDATSFCRGKIRFMGLLLEYHGGWPYELSGTEDFAIIEAMTVKEFEASGLTARVELPRVETPLRIGKKGGAEWMVLFELSLIPAGNDEQAGAVDAILKIQTVFA